MKSTAHVVKDHGQSSSHGGSNYSEHSVTHHSGGHSSPAHHETTGNAHLVAHGGGGGGGGGGHGGFGGGGGGGHSFGGGGFGGMSHAFSGGMSHAFSGPSTSRSFSGGNFSGNSFSGSRAFSPQSLSRSGASGLGSNWSHGNEFSSMSGRSFNSSNWARGQSDFHVDHNSSAWQQHLSNWNHGEQWSHGNNHWLGDHWANSNWHNGDHFHDGHFHDDHFHDHFHNGFWWGSGWWWGHDGFCYYPAIAVGAILGLPWWYDSYYYPSCDYLMPYYDTTAYAAYADPQVVAGQPEVVQSQYATDPPPQQVRTTTGSNAGAEYYSEATNAFHNGQYRDALRLANHAAVESPQNAKAHELMSLAMFASADYRGAAAEAHAALAFGPPAAWATVYGYYGDDSTYTNQLRALEKYSRENPTAADARFLRAYQYLMLGHETAAVEQLRETAKLAPQDRLVAEMLKKYGDTGAEKPPLLPPNPAPIPNNPGAGGGPKPVDGIDS
jgi:hypothetical protein